MYQMKGIFYNAFLQCIVDFLQKQSWFIYLYFYDDFKILSREMLDDWFLFDADVNNVNQKVKKEEDENSY